MTRSVYAMVLAALPAFAQPPAQARLTFEAASVKPAEQETGWIATVKAVNPIRITYRNYSLKRLITEAYDVSRYQVEGPPWIERERYDIVANTPRGASAGQVALMMQSLLAERFHLVMHTVKRDLAAYVLSPGKDASKLRPARDEAEVPGCKSFGTISDYAEMLSVVLDKPVVNQTGVLGTYYFFLIVVPDLLPSAPAGPTPGAAPPPPPPAPPPSPCYAPKAGKMPPASPTVFDAVKDQMGLKLERRANMQVNVLVIDRAGKTPEKN